MKLGTRYPFEAFKLRVDKLRTDLTNFIDRERSTGKTFYLYGASTKGNTLLQYCGLDASKIVAAAERNPEKWGCHTPGTGSRLSLNKRREPLSQITSSSCRGIFVTNLFNAKANF